MRSNRTPAMTPPTIAPTFLLPSVVVVSPVVPPPMTAPPPAPVEVEVPSTVMTGTTDDEVGAAVT